MNLKGCGRKRSWPNLRYDPGIFMEGLTETTKYRSQEIAGLPPLAKYEAGVLTVRRHLVVPTYIGRRRWILSNYFWTGNTNLLHERESFELWLSTLEDLLVRRLSS